MEVDGKIEKLKADRCFLAKKKEEFVGALSGLEEYLEDKELGKRRQQWGLFPVY